MHDTTHQVPARLAPFLAQWDYITGVLFERLADLSDEEYLWEPATEVWTVRLVDGKPKPDVEAWAPDASGAPPRTLAWSIGHLGDGAMTRADWLVGSHSIKDGDLTWPMTAAEGIAFARAGLGVARRPRADDRRGSRHGRPERLPGRPGPRAAADRDRLVGRKELLFHTGEIWFVRDLYAHTADPHGLTTSGYRISTTGRKFAPCRTRS